jgi:hypothetical protein
MRVRMKLALAGSLLFLGCNAGGPNVVGNTQSAFSTGQHVLLLSVDGMHQLDFDNYVATHPASTLAMMAARGKHYTHVTSSRPSDSFPGTLAMTTGGSPRATGYYYDVTWDDNLSPPGSGCSTRGTVVPFDGQINVDDTQLNTTIDPNKLPLDPDNGCSLVYPHNHLNVNTIFEVAKAAGYRTAVTDKHPAYELLNGPSGTGVDDLYTPENDSDSIKKVPSKTRAYDETKVQVVMNWIDGFEQTRTTHVGVPGIIMMNFQAVNIGEKVGGYLDAAGTPSTELALSLDYVDGAIGRMLAEIDAQGLTASTTVIVTAKHGQTPIDLTTRRAIDPALIDATVNSVQDGLLAQETPDTISLIWLKDHSRTDEVVARLQANSAALGIETIYSGAALDNAFDGTLDLYPNRRADIIIEPQHGVIYTTSSASTKKCEHGSFNDESTHVPLVMYGNEVTAGTNDTPVDLRQVAPTVLKLLHLKGDLLDAVRMESTPRLPD